MKLQRDIQVDFGNAGGTVLTVEKKDGPIDGRVYIAHSPIDRVFADWGVRQDRATVAIRKVGDNFEYTYTVCDKKDNFSRKIGAELATRRLGHGMCWRTSALRFPRMGETWAQAIVRFANELAINIVAEPNKFKRKISAAVKAVAQ